MSTIQIPEIKGVSLELIEILNDRFRRLSKATASTSTATSGSYVGTHADRNSKPATTVAAGAFFYETDRTVFYFAENSTGANKWIYAGGTMRGTIFSPDQKPTNLGTNDKGFQFYSTDYEHLYRWTGSAWEYAPGDDGSGYLAMYTETPNKGAWKLADGTGSPVRRSLANGSTATVTLNDLRGAYPKLAAAYTGSTVAAVTPGLTGNTADESSHTHAIDHNHAAEVSGIPSSTIVAASGAGVTIASSTHTHTTDLASISATSGAGGTHGHGAGTLAVDATGQPLRIEVLPYYRL